jgi:hypothetical protein
VYENDIADGPDVAGLVANKVVLNALREVTGRQIFVDCLSLTRGAHCGFRGWAIF